MSNFSDYLKKRRAELELSTRDIERMAGVSKAYVTQLENAKRNPPTPDKIAKLAPVLNVSYEKLMEIAGYLVIPDDPKYAGLKAVCITDEYRARGLSEADIRKALDIAVAFVEGKKKSKS